MCSYFSSEEYHKFLKDSSKGIIKAGIGILTNSEERKRRAEEIMEKAERLVRNAKSLGKNRVVV